MIQIPQTLEPFFSEGLLPLRAFLFIGNSTYWNHAGPRVKWQRDIWKCESPEN